MWQSLVQFWKLKIVVLTVSFFVKVLCRSQQMKPLTSQSHNFCYPQHWQAKHDAPDREGKSGQTCIVAANWTKTRNRCHLESSIAQTLNWLVMDWLDHQELVPLELLGVSGRTWRRSSEASSAGVLPRSSLQIERRSTSSAPPPLLRGESVVEELPTTPPQKHPLFDQCSGCEDSGPRERTGSR
jgi:hypothetical protein